MGTSNYSGTSNNNYYEVGTLAVDGWAVTFGTARMGLGAVGGTAVLNVTTHPSTASVPTSYYSIWHYNCFLTLKG